MQPYRFILGLNFVRPAFSLSSVQGVLSDILLDIGEEEKQLGSGYFDGIKTLANEGGINLFRKDHSNMLSVTQSDIIFRKTLTGNKAVNIGNTVDEFKLLFKAISRKLKIKGIRRVGFVVEYRQAEQNKYSAANELRDGFLSFKGFSDSRLFDLRFEDRTIIGKLEDHNENTDAYTNCIHTIYLSEKDDQTKENGKLCFSLDFQQYFNPTVPAKGVNVELNKVMKDFKLRKKSFIEQMNTQGFLKND